MTTTPLVGCAGFPVDPDEYASQLSFVEIQESFVNPPDIAEAKALWGRVAGDLKPAFVAWQVITHPRSHAGYKVMGGLIPEHAAVGHFVRSRWTDEAWERMDSLARAVRAPVILFRTPPGFRRTKANITQFENFIAHAQRPSLSLAWEWDGWPPGDALAMCERIGLVPAVDPFATAVPPGDEIYLRIKTKGSPSDAKLEKLASQIRGREGCVVFANGSAWEDARRLAKLL